MHVAAFEGFVTTGVVMFPLAVDDAVDTAGVLTLPGNELVVVTTVVPDDRLVVRGVVVEIGPNVDVVL